MTEGFITLHYPNTTPLHPNAILMLPSQEKEGAPFVLPPPPYRVSFAHDLKMIIKESRYLDKLGFRIPESALNVTLQESKYQSISRSLTSKLQFYDQLISSLKPVEKILLKV